MIEGWARTNCQLRLAWTLALPTTNYQLPTTNYQLKPGRSGDGMFFKAVFPRRMRVVRCVGGAEDVRRAASGAAEGQSQVRRGERCPCAG